MIFCVQGKQRNGKTVFMTTIAKNYHDAGFHVISNIQLTFDYIEFDEQMFYSDEKIIAMKKKYKTNKFFIILADAHLLLSAHMAKRDAKKMYFVTQVGKMLEEKGHFMYDTQRYFQMNKTLRENTDWVINIHKLSGKDDPLVCEIDILEDQGSHFVSINTVIVGEESLVLGLFERFGRTKLSEGY